MKSIVGTYIPETFGRKAMLESSVIGYVISVKSKLPAHLRQYSFTGIKVVSSNLSTLNSPL